MEGDKQSIESMLEMVDPFFFGISYEGQKQCSDELRQRINQIAREYGAKTEAEEEELYNIYSNFLRSIFEHEISANIYSEDNRKSTCLATLELNFDCLPKLEYHLSEDDTNLAPMRVGAITEVLNIVEGLSSSLKDRKLITVEFKGCNLSFQCKKCCNKEYIDQYQKIIKTYLNSKRGEKDRSNMTHQINTVSDNIQSARRMQKEMHESMRKASEKEKHLEEGLEQAIESLKDAKLDKVDGQKVTFEFEKRPADFFDSLNELFEQKEKRGIIAISEDKGVFSEKYQVTLDESEMKKHFPMVSEKYHELTNRLFKLKKPEEKNYEPKKEGIRGLPPIKKKGL